MKAARSDTRPLWIFLDHCALDGGAQISLQAFCSGLKGIGLPILELGPSHNGPFPLTVRRRLSGLFALMVNIIFCFIIHLKHFRSHWYCNSVLDRLQCALIPSFLIVTHIRDIPKPWHALAMRVFPSKAYVVSSEFMRRRMSQIAPNVGPVHIIHNIVSEGLYRRDVFADEPLTFRVLMVANLVPWKKHVTSIEAVALLASVGFPVYLDIWGSDALMENQPYRTLLWQLIRSLPKGTVSLVEGKRIRQENFSKYHCLLHPAGDEPFGRVLAEATLAGLPIVGSDSGNTGAFIKRYSAGIIYPSDSPHVVAGAIVLLQNQYTYFQNRLRKNQERIANDFSVQNALRQFSESGLLGF